MAKKWWTFIQASVVIFLVGATVTGMLLLLLDQGASQAVAPTPTSPPHVYTYHGLAATTINIHLGLVFNSHVMPVTQEQGKIDIVWGALHPNTPADVYNMAYNPSDRIGNDNFGAPLYSITWFQQHHPDWIEYQCDKTTPAYEFSEPNTPLDITNPVVLDFLMQNEYIPEIQAGYNAIGFDNVSFLSAWGRCGHFDQRNRWIAQFTGGSSDPAFRQAVVDRSRIMYDKLHAYQPDISVTTNFAYDFKYPDLSDQIIHNLDVWTDERGFTNGGTVNDQFTVDLYWQKLVAIYQHFQAQGGALFAINEEPSPTISRDQTQWALANYLMIRGQHTYMTLVGRQQYGYLLDHPEFHIPIGAATGPMTTDQCVFQRDFGNAIAIVNPSSSLSCPVTEPPNTYTDMYGAPITTLQIKPHSGIVLIKTSNH